MTPRLSVVVPTRDRPAHLDACLAALTQALRPDDELIVVDSASRAHSVGETAVAHGARLVRCDRPGASRARNAGASAARAEVVVFVDDDVRVDASWADALADALVDSSVAFVAGRVSVPAHQAGYQRPVAVNDSDSPALLDASVHRVLANSANLGIRRDVLLGLGGFDEALGGGARFEAAEDLDLYDRLFAAGYVGRYEPAALAWHEQWRSRRQLLRLDWRYGVGSGARLAKLLRSDRRRARGVLVEVVWRGDALEVGRAARRREEFAALTGVVRLLGTAAGLLVGLATPVRDGHYAVS